MSKLYRADGSLAFGVYFNKPDGYLAQTVIQQVLLPALIAGEKLIISAQTTVSCLANPSIGYPGWHDNLFTAAQMYLSPGEQGTWFNPSGTLPVSCATGQDIQSGGLGGAMQPYYDHHHTALYEVPANQIGDRWVSFVVWCSCYSATGNSVEKNEYIWVIPQQTTMQVLRLDS